MLCVKAKSVNDRQEKILSARSSLDSVKVRAQEWSLKLRLRGDSLVRVLPGDSVECSTLSLESAKPVLLIVELEPKLTKVGRDTISPLLAELSHVDRYIS